MMLLHNPPHVEDGSGRWSEWCGAKAIAYELARQLSVFPGQWVEVDTLIADGGTVLVEWHGGFTASRTTIHTKVMAVFEIDEKGRIKQVTICKPGDIARMRVGC